MARLRFGAFLAPHHPIGEHPTLQFRSDLELAAHLDELGFDEFWCGEHHSTGWETIASPGDVPGRGRRAHRIGSGSAPAWSRCRTTTRSTSPSASCSSTT